MKFLKILTCLGKIAIYTLVIISTPLFASDKTDISWEKQLKAHNISGVDQAYCYSDEQNQTNGKNINMRIKLASVSKLMTSLWALEILGAHYKYETKLYIKGNNLHIKGSLDPFMGNEKIFFLLSQLNDLGYTKFDLITFDKTIQINPNAEIASNQYPIISRSTNARNLKMYFNTKEWPEELRAEYSRIAALDTSRRMRKFVDFEIRDAQFVESNPYENDNEVKPLTLASPEILKYLKEINVQSNNYAAHTIFLKLGGEAKFEKFLNERYGKTSNAIHFYNGSGLPQINNSIRYDNYSTCNVTTELIAALKYSAEDQGINLSDLLAVPGIDAGTFNNRAFPRELINSVMAKTGTLTNISNLAGIISSSKGFSFYGIFNNSKDIEGSKIVQNEMLKSLMSELGGPLIFNYSLKAFHTFKESLFSR